MLDFEPEYTCWGTLKAFALATLGLILWLMIMLVSAAIDTCRWVWQKMRGKRA